ncbi:MAG: hypothetical protein JO057_18280 [Chloroflexi bacterium]|nr:hypothetical protein [Chloroflexota bacterium]
MVTMFWTYRVADVQRWADSMAVLNADDAAARGRRDQYGMVRRWVYRSVDDPQEVMLVAEFRTREGAEALLTDPEGMRRWYERTGLEVFPPVLITENLTDLNWTREAR